MLSPDFRTYSVKIPSPRIGFLGEQPLTSTHIMPHYYIPFLSFLQEKMKNLFKNIFMKLAELSSLVLCIIYIFMSKWILSIPLQRNFQPLKHAKICFFRYLFEKISKNECFVIFYSQVCIIIMRNMGFTGDRV